MLDGTFRSSSHPKYCLPETTMEHPFSASKRQCRPHKMTIPQEDPVEDLCERMAQLHLWSTEPLERFELFPRLPKELRRLIFKFALPSTNKMITATAHCRELMPRKLVCVSFTIPPQRPGMPPQSKESRDVRLLKVCWESREVFLENRKVNQFHLATINVDQQRRPRNTLLNAHPLIQSFWRMRL